MLDPEDFYLEDGLMVLTERYHLKRGVCCGNGCRHCPYRHVSVEKKYREPVSGAAEIPLLGGDVTEGVVRVGSTVRRPPGAQSAAIHAFLDHLERVSFSESPRFLGIDERGREVLTYIEGEIAGRPLRSWAIGDDVLAAIAALQRRLHDASVDFALPDGVAWTPPLELPGIPPPLDGAPEIVGHNDLTPENMIFIDRKPVGLIDFDLAHPTTRVLDVVNALIWWAPLRDPADRDPLLRDADAGSRMRTFVDAYGLDESGRSALVDVAIRRYERSWHAMRRRAEVDGGGWARMWREGVGDVIRRSGEWVRSERVRLETALRV